MKRKSLSSMYHFKIDEFLFFMLIILSMLFSVIVCGLSRCLDLAVSVNERLLVRKDEIRAVSLCNKIIM